MIIERSMHPDWLSNTYLVADERGRHRGGDRRRAARPGRCSRRPSASGVDVEHLLLTHHHADHVAEDHVWRERYGVETLPTRSRPRLLEGVDRTIEPGEVVEAGGLAIGSLHTPGHTAGMLNFVVNGTDVFTGDTLFAARWAACGRPGSTSFEDLRHSIMDVLMALPPETRLHPGHTDPTTVGDEWESNAFVRAVARPRRRGRRAAARSGTRRRRSCCGRPTTTAATRPGCAGRTARDDIVPGSRVSR